VIEENSNETVKTEEVTEETAKVENAPEEAVKTEEVTEETAKAENAPEEAVKTEDAAEETDENGDTVEKKKKFIPKRSRITRPKFLQDLERFDGFGLDKEEDKSDFDEMVSFYEETLEGIEEGEVVNGVVLNISKDGILVDIGFKSEGFVPLNSLEEGLSDTIKVGDTLEVFLEEKEDSEGMVVLSREKANKAKIWDKIGEVFENDEELEGRVIKKIKGGLTVDIGIPAFLPGSQVDLRPVKNLDKFMGELIKVKVIKLNKKRGNIVLSRRVLLESDRNMEKKKTLESLQEGNVVEGIIKNITDYGAFVDLGGIDGLLHVTDMSWGRVRHPSEMFSIGDKSKVVVLKFDQETERVSLGMKQLTPDPWENADEKYAKETRVKGKVVSLTDYGAFVELEEGVEGLVHVSEMSWTNKIKHPSKVVSMGEEVEAIVIDIKKENKRISLGIKQIEPNPWLVVEEKYDVGTKIEGKVRNLADFGAFIELEEGIDGLVHISDMSWTKRIKHPSEILKKGDVVEVIILKIDAKNERLSLGIKQVQPDPWKEIESKYKVGDNLKRIVVRTTDFGAFIEIENGVEGLIHVSEFGGKDKERKNVKDIVAVGDELLSKVIRIDPGTRKIGLSVKAYKDAEERANIEKYSKVESDNTPFQPVLSSENAEKVADISKQQAESDKEESKEE